MSIPTSKRYERDLRRASTVGIALQWYERASPCCLRGASCGSLHCGSGAGCLTALWIAVRAHLVPHQLGPRIVSPTVLYFVGVSCYSHRFFSRVVSSDVPKEVYTRDVLITGMRFVLCTRYTFVRARKHPRDVLKKKKLPCA